MTTEETKPAKARSSEPQDVNLDELIEMTHPDLPGDERSAVTRRALSDVWAPKGWVEAKPKE